VQLLKTRAHYDSEGQCVTDTFHETNYDSSSVFLEFAALLIRSHGPSRLFEQAFNNPQLLPSTLLSNMRECLCLHIGQGKKSRLTHSTHHTYALHSTHYLHHALHSISHSLHSSSTPSSHAAGVQTGNGTWELLCLEHGKKSNNRFIQKCIYVVTMRVTLSPSNYYESLVTTFKYSTTKFHVHLI
jgi:hypothetical protein